MAEILNIVEWLNRLGLWEMLPFSNSSFLI